MVDDPEAVQIPDPDPVTGEDPKPDDTGDDEKAEPEVSGENEEPAPSRPSSLRPTTSRPASSKEELAPPMSRQQSVKSQRSVTFSTTSSDGNLIEADDEEIEKKSKQNCCVAIIAGMWASREMLKDNKDQQLYVKVTLRELFVYCIFMFIICYATFTPYSPYNYQLTNQITGIFPTIPSITNMKQFWANFIGDVTGVGGVYWEIWYNSGMIPANVYINCPDGTPATGPCATELADRGILFENRILGLPRLRQLKVTNDSCDINADFKSAIKVCFAPYDKTLEETGDFLPDFREFTSIEAWTYQTADELGGTSFTGEMATYSGAGYTQNLHQSLNVTSFILSELQAGKWIDQGTRFVTFDMTVYNANVNLFCMIKLYFEFPATGGVFPRQEFTTVKLLKYTSTGDYALMAAEFIFCLFILYYIVEESLEIKVHGIAYFFTFWNILDLGVIGISVAQIALNLYNQFVISTVLVDLLDKPFEYADFSRLAKTSRVLTQISAFNVMVAWIKLFKYLSFNKTMTQLSGTLSAAAKDLGGFSVMFFIIYFAFVQLGYLLFGVQCHDFRTFTTSVLTLFRMILGDFNFKAIEQANVFLGPIYFLSYIFFVFFVLLNMFLAIINDTYGEVKAEVNSAKAEFQMGDFFKTGSNNLKSYMGIQDRAIDVENAIKLASADDGFVTYEELRENLRKARFSDIEIDIFFFYFKNDPQMSQMMLDEEELKARQMEKVGNDLSRPSIGGNSDQPQRRKSRAMSIAPNKDNKPDANLNQDEGGAGAARPLSGKMARQIRSAEIRASAKAEFPVNDEEFYSLSTRVDQMESSIIPLGHKIDFMLARLDSVFKERKLKKDDMEKIFEGIVSNDEGAWKDELTQAIKDKQF